MSSFMEALKSGYNTFMFGKEKAAPPPPKPAGFGEKIKADIWDYINNPLHKVMDEPVKAVFHSTAIKIISLFIALIFPFIGYGMIGASVALIDRIILMNLGEFSKRFFENLSIDNIQNIYKSFSNQTLPAAR